MSRSEKQIKKISGEQGAVTLLAIGLSAMLLMVGIAFLTTSMIERKASLNYQSMNNARALAKTAFNRALANLKFKSSKPQESMNLIASHDKNITANSETEKNIYGHTLAEELTTYIDNSLVYEIPSDYPHAEKYDITSEDSISWIYIYSHYEDNPDLERTIIGRIAYVVLPDKGKIDPWAIIDSGYNAYDTNKTPPSEYNYGSGVTSIDPEGNSIIGRPGKNANEMCLESLTFDSESYPSFFTSDYATKMSVKTANPPGLVDSGAEGDYKRYEVIFDMLGIDASDNETRQFFTEVFYADASGDDEKYWRDDNGDLIREAGEMRERFNLSRTDWETLNTTSPNFEPLAWLYRWNDPAGIPGGGNDYQIAKSQIIANLIDYSDADNIATTDDQNNPTFVGLEKVPYINRAWIHIPLEMERIEELPPVWIIKERDNIKTGVQLVNMYDSTFPDGSVKAAIELELLYKFCFTEDGSDTDFYESTGTNSLTRTFGPVIAKNYSHFEQDSLTSNSLLQTIRSENGDIFAEVTIRKFWVKLTDSGDNLYDFSKIIDISDQTTKLIGSLSATGELDLYLDFQVRDPRQNLYPKEWTCFTMAEPPNSVSLSQNNSVYPPYFHNPLNSFDYSDTDKEPDGVAPWEISTAYIRNSPMISPWELGFIHRAKAFQTINLKKFNTSVAGSGYGRTAGGSTYSDGDANLLDQIKMTSDKKTRGKINLNSDNPAVLRTLFDRIKIGSSYSSPGNGGDSISTASAEALAQEVLTINGTIAGTQLLSRAQIINLIPDLKNGTYGTQDSDAREEELIGKFINLTKVEDPNYFTIITVGQAINDIGYADKEVTVYKRVKQSDNTYKLKSIQAKKGRFDPDADEILASQKIYARMKKNPSGNDFYIEDIKYLD